MSISYLIVMLALSNMQHDVALQPGAFVTDRYVSRGTGEVLLASGGNPWALSVPDAEYPSGSIQPPPVEPGRPRYITPEELKSFESSPEYKGKYGSNWAPLNTDGLLKNRRHTMPLYGGSRYGYPGYSGRGNNPFYGGYGYPSYPGISPLTDPYGGSPYGDIPSGGVLPFMY